MRRPCMDGKAKPAERLCATQTRLPRYTPSTLDQSDVDCLIRNCGQASTSQSVSDLQNQGRQIFGKALENIMSVDDKDSPFGIPPFIYDLSRRILDYANSYDILVFMESSVPSAGTSDDGQVPNVTDSECPSEAHSEASYAIVIFRHFLAQLPQPLMCQRTVASLAKHYDDLKVFGENGDVELFDESVFQIRNSLYQRLPWHTYQFLQFLMGVFHQMCSATPKTQPGECEFLNKIISQVLTKDESALPLAKMLLYHYSAIFQDMDQFQEKSNSSDSISSTGGDSREETTDEADLLTPEEEGVFSSQWFLDSPAHVDVTSTHIDNDSASTTDTDDFRSPLVSPGQFPESPSDPLDFRSPRRRSSGDGDDNETYLHDTFPFTKEICRQGEPGDASSDSDRYADRSDNGADDYYCPHEERRSSERFLRRTGNQRMPSGRKVRRKLKKKHLQPLSERLIPSSSEDDREEIRSLTDLISDDSAPSPFDPSPSSAPDSFSSLLSYRRHDDDEHHHAHSAGPAHRHAHRYREHRHAHHEADQENSAAFNWLKITQMQRNDGSWYVNEDEERDDIEYSEEPSPSSSGSKSFVKPFLSGGAGEAALQSISRNVSGWKKKLRRFEDDLERSFHYRQPMSYSGAKLKHKEAKKHHPSDFSKTKKELKRIKDEIIERKITKHLPKSLLRCQESTAQDANRPVSSQTPEETYRHIEEGLDQKRLEARRPLDVLEQSMEQLKDEKADVQRVLLFYESMHGRPTSKEEKELVRPLYDRYRLVKRTINKMKLKQKENAIELAPILEHVVMDFTSPQHRGSLKDDFDEKCPWEAESSENPILLNVDPHPDMVPAKLSPTIDSPELSLSGLHALPIQELKERKKEAKEEKRTLRHALRDFEEKFEKETGRKMQKEDRGCMEKTYNEYKHTKAKLRLLEALLSKHSA